MDREHVKEMVIQTTQTKHNTEIILLLKHNQQCNILGHSTNVLTSTVLIFKEAV